MISWEIFAGNLPLLSSSYSESSSWSTSSWSPSYITTYTYAGTWGGGGPPPPAITDTRTSASVVTYTSSSSSSTSVDEHPYTWNGAYATSSTRLSTEEGWVAYTEAYDAETYLNYSYGTISEYPRTVTTMAETSVAFWTTSLRGDSLATATISEFVTSSSLVEKLTTSHTTTTRTSLCLTTFDAVVTSGYYDTVVMADSSEVLWVVDSSGLGIMQPSQVPFLSDVATTMTRFTVSHRDIYETAQVTFVGTGLILRDGTSYPGFTETATYIIPGANPPYGTKTVTDYMGAVPTPTRTVFGDLVGRSTHAGTFTVKEMPPYGWPYSGSGEDLYSLKTNTYILPVLGKRSRVSGSLVYDEIVQTGVDTITYQEWDVDGRKMSGFESSSGPDFAWSRAMNTRVTVDASVYPAGLSDTYTESWQGLWLSQVWRQIPENPAFIDCIVAHPLGVMTSPESYAGRLSLASTTLTAPTYANFHRAGGGVALMPTSASYTANVSAVTYTAIHGSLTSTFSEVLSTSGTGLTSFNNRGLFNNYWPPIPKESVRLGGAAGFLETIYAAGFGRVKINGVESYLDPVVSSTTESSAAASHVEYPALARTAATDYAAEGPFFLIGGWQPQEFMPD